MFDSKTENIKKMIFKKEEQFRLHQNDVLCLLKTVINNNFRKHEPNTP